MLLDLRSPAAAVDREYRASRRMLMICDMVTLHEKATEEDEAEFWLPGHIQSQSLHPDH